MGESRHNSHCLKSAAWIGLTGSSHCWVGQNNKDQPADSWHWTASILQTHTALLHKYNLQPPLLTLLSLSSFKLNTFTDFTNIPTDSPLFSAPNIESINEAAGVFFAIELL